LYDAFIAKVKEYTEKSQPGNPILEETKLGPLANKSSYERFTRLFEDAKIKGATVICGGKRVGEKGYAVQPAVLENVSENMLIMQEEIFGPILPVKKLQDINAVIDEVNDSEYGLGFSVWTKNIAKGKEIASQVFVGTAVVNGLPRTDINSPWGGMRKSGLGRILSPIGMKVFTEPKNLRYPKE
jgi:acyl-CoA reductase-like NAD-dependent aldehyde dehydrogenase